jgi:putative (di)nucleoside polyphosphate hydrolase
MFRKGVSALIINSNQEFLIVNLESFEPRFFAVPGGGLDEGETLEQAVYREIQEELGIAKKSLEFVGASQEPLQVRFKTKKLQRDGVEYDGSERFFFGFRFIGTDHEIVTKDGEVRSYKWVPFEKLQDHLLFDGQLEDTAEKIMEIFPEMTK